MDYIHWSFVQDVLKYLDKKTRQWITDKDNAAYGIKKELERQVEKLILNYRCLAK